MQLAIVDRATKAFTWRRNVWRHRWLMVQPKLFPRAEKRRATKYWATLDTYHLTNEAHEVDLARSRWVAQDVLGELAPTSVLEVGPNTGRNLAAIREHDPAIRLRGLDVNPKAVAHGRRLHPDLDLVLADAHDWPEPPDSWDVLLTMSVLDHVPEAGIETLAASMAATARVGVVAVELWDGEAGVRGPYKYSRDTRALFERHGLETTHWERAAHQYGEDQSPMWLYVGRKPS